MDTERLGIELADLICETFAESIEEITTTLDRRIDDVSLDYIALLLWIATKEASFFFPGKSSEEANDVAYFLIFNDFLKKTGAKFSAENFQKFIQDRFEIYYGAFNEATVDEDDVMLRRNFNVITRFIICCFEREAEYLKVIAHEYDSVVESAVLVVAHHYNRFLESVMSVLSRFSFQPPALTQRATVSAQRDSGRDYGIANDYFVDFVAAEIKKDISSLMALGIKLDKGSLAAKTGGAGLAGYEALSGDWLSALVIGGVSLLVGGLTNGYKRIKLMEMKKRWMDRFSGLSQEQLVYLETGLRHKYPMLMGQLQNLLQAPEG